MLVIVLGFITLCPFKFCDHLDERELIVVALLLLSFRCLATVNVL